MDLEGIRLDRSLRMVAMNGRGEKVGRIVQRIERQVGVPNLSEILRDGMKPTDLQSLLLEVYKGRVGRRDPRAVLSDYASNRFTSPSSSDPALLLEWDRVALSQLPAGYNAIELSPVSPLGSVSSLAPVSQDWVLTTIRNVEVVADPTNALALECALRRGEIIKCDSASTTSVRLACSHRVTRTQRYRNPSAAQHFRLFSLCSGGRNTESRLFDVDAAIEHITFYARSLRAFLGQDVPLRATVTQLAPDPRREGFLGEELEGLGRQIPNLETILQKPQKNGKAYYQGLRFQVHAVPSGKGEIELVDGGMTDWTQKLLNNGRERLVTSAVGSERVCEMLGA